MCACPDLTMCLRDAVLVKTHIAPMFIRENYKTALVHRVVRNLHIETSYRTSNLTRISDFYILTRLLC